MTWQQRAACGSADPNLFTATTLAAARPALDICRGCPVTTDCWRQRGGSHGSLPGVWAGQVYDDYGRQVREPVSTQKPIGEPVGRCTACGRAYSFRGRDDCAAGSDCRRQATVYQRARHERRRELIAAQRARTEGEGTAA